MMSSMKMHFKFTSETQEEVVLHALRSILQDAVIVKYEGKKYIHVIVCKKYKGVA